MSQDPFSNPNARRPSSGSPVAETSPFDPTGPPKKKRRVWLWVLLTVLGGGFLSLIVCCGAGAYFVQNYGSAIFEPARVELNQLADVREEVGDIESLSMNFFETVEEGKSNPEFVILDGQSETGPFQVSVKMTNDAKLEKAFLVMPDGSRKPIDLERLVSATAEIASPDGADTPGAEVDADDQVIDATERELRELESDLGQ